MASCNIKRALISVYDKTGIVDFARALVDELGIEILSTGGTARLLAENKVPVTLVEETTGFPEMMNGRVKTLHPKIHAGILADRANPDHMRQLEEQGIRPIDMVVVNLYPFEDTIADPDCTFQQAIEMIDIGGPCMLRAAAKNHRHVIPIAHSRSIEAVLDELRNEGDLTAILRACLASIVFETTAIYDDRVDEYLTAHWGKILEDSAPEEARKTLEKLGIEEPDRFLKTDQEDVIPDPVIIADPVEHRTRYGENPHQVGALTSDDSASAPNLIEGSEIEPSFNNYADANAALELCKELARGRNQHSCVFIKHTNACGVASGTDPIETYRQAYLGDPNAAMGGILACNFRIDTEFARAVMESYSRWGKDAGAGGFFTEVWIATGFDDSAIEVIRTTKEWGKRVRLLSAGDMTIPPQNDELEFKSITGGMLVQTRDNVGLNEEQWKVVSKRTPSDSEMENLRLAWLICKHTKSNAITLCRDGMLIGNGAGQMSRVMSCRIAKWLAEENGHADKIRGSVAASDAFFPFPDGPNILMDAGVTAIIQPGGSKRDEDTIKACNERNVAMILTGTRHFKH